MKSYSKSLSTLVIGSLFIIPAAFAGTSTPVINTSAVTTNDTGIYALANPSAGLSKKVLQEGLNAYKWAQAHGQVTKPYLTIVNFSVPSKNKRLWVINLQTNQVVYHTLVANGKNSGLFNATKFSNTPGSDESSLGVYVTGKTFVGNDGYSLRLQGLQPGYNSNAYNRLIVMHHAWYVTKSFAAKYGRVGRSWGCFAMSPAIATKVINTVKNGSVIFAYANSETNNPATETSAV